MNYRDQFDLTGKVAAVTGGAGGIGLETAKALASCGAKIALLDLDRDALDKAASSLKDEGFEASVYVANVTVPSEVNAAAQAVIDTYGRVDILVNSAGIARLHTALDVTDDEWRLVMDINVNGTFWASRAFGKYMVENKQGSIVNLGSMSGIIINRPQYAASYMASKGAVHMLTKALAVEWVDHGVRVNAVAPGYVGTDMTLAMRARPELFDVWMDMTPMKRCGEPSEIASTILFLASPASSYVTGSILSVDGGYTAY
jgi:NAD(P)-dependent dehydrogenase (short-subunit alcohol dehydrogenase family)